MPTTGADPRVLHVMVGVVSDAHGRILIARRAPSAHQGGLLEFPGGKLEHGETPFQALARELHEEVGIEVLASRPLIRIRHDYPDRRVLLDVHRVSAFRGEPQGREGQPLAWFEPQALDPREFPAANRAIITAVRLPEFCLITGEDPQRHDEFIARLEQALSDGIRLVQLRAHALDDRAYARLAGAAFACCERHDARLLLNRDPRLACELPRHGLHLSSVFLTGLQARPGRADELVGASCHDAATLVRAQKLGLDYALLSPVRPTLSHSQAAPLGWKTFESLVAAAALPVYALGGLSRDDLEIAREHGAQGIAAIRSLWPVSAAD